MSFAGSSRPASGSEHHLSHYFEITGILRQEPYFSHGLDVAYSTVVTAKLREYLLSHPWPAQPDRPKDREAAVRRIYGSVAEDCIRLQEKAGWYCKDLFSVYKAKESQLRAILAEMPTSAQIEEMLAAAGIYMADFHQLYPTQKQKDAILYAKELKDRYSVLWLYYELFGGNGHDFCI
jgi:glycerol-1-phosphate dehydrogenase [NAD(P)+]